MWALFLWWSHTDDILFLIPLLILDAVNDILGRSVIEVRKNAFDFDSTEKKTLGWTPIQFWTVMKQLAAHDVVSSFFFSLSSDGQSSLLHL